MGESVYILEMLKLQQRLNDNTNGKGWERGTTKNGKIINWNRCIYLEVAELIDSYPWKHWKNIDSTPDYENIKIEIVDIWHFVMSEALRVYKIENRGDIEKLASDIENLEEFKEFSKDKRDIPENIYKQIELIEELPKAIFCKKDIEKIISKFFKIAQIALDYRELYRLYIGKNILNIFRQDHGYKRGNYKKVWGGKEDNIILQDILENSPDIKPNDLYRALEDRYPKE
jgi:hypothetical protein